MMKLFKNTSILLLIFCLFTSFSAPDQGTVTIKINDLRNSKGFVLISLFDKEEHFPKEASKAVGKSKVTILNGTAIVTFKNLPYGKYAAAVLHDENDNLKMDFNFVGMPKEGYGFSNDAKGSFGPPPFNKAAFELNETEKNIEISIVYFL